MRVHSTRLCVHVHDVAPWTSLRRRSALGTTDGRTSVRHAPHTAASTAIPVSAEAERRVVCGQ